MQQPTGSNKLPKIILHLVFLLTGIASVLIGQILPILSRNFSLNDLQLGYFFPSQFLGSITGTFLSGWFSHRGKYAHATALGCLLMAVGIALIAAGKFEVCIAGFIINGLGIGMTIPSINLLVLELKPAHPASALSILNFCWGVGAIICKPFVDTLSAGVSIWSVSLPLSTSLVLFSCAVYIAARPLSAANNFERKAESDDDTPRIWANPLAWGIALFNFIHVGFEGGMGGWLSTYTERLENRAVLDIVSPTFLYFLFFVIGRGIAPIFFRYLSENRMLFLNLALLLTGTVITLMAGNMLILSVGAAVAGIGTSTIFPTNLSRFINTFGPAASRQATPLFVCGTAGAASVTWLIGYFSNEAGNLAAGMAVLLVSIVLLIVMQTVLALKTSKRSAR